LTSQPNLLKGLAWIGLAILCWTPMLPIAKRALPVVDAFALATWRYSVGAVLFLALLAAIEGRRALGYGGKLLPATVFGVIGFAGFNLLVWLGLAHSQPEHAAVILALQTPMTALTVWAVRGQRPRAFTLGCVAAAIAGVLAVVTRGEPAAAIADLARGGALLGDLLVLLGALAWVIYTLAAGHFAGWSALRLTALTSVPGAIAIAIANVFAVRAGIAAVPELEALGSVAWQLAYFVLGSTVLGVLSFNASVVHLGPLNSMLMLNVVPVGVFAIEAALGRSFGAVELGGAAAVVGALVANNLYLRGVSARR
jgi:drug/metabolite transporter (DMT)-like permease